MSAGPIIRAGQSERPGEPGSEDLTRRARRRDEYWPAGMSHNAWAMKRFLSDARMLRAAGSKLAEDAEECARWMARDIIAGVR